VFWVSFLSSYGEGVSQYALIICSSFALDHFACLGRINTHKFLSTGTIPLQISEATIQQAVTGNVTDECLIESFKMLLHEKERDVINKALEGCQQFPQTELIDILLDYGVASIPKPNTVRDILLQVAKTELVSKPYACIIKFREGMGSFWDDITAEEIHALYVKCTPTVSNVAGALYLDKSTPQGEKVFTWLVRYLCCTTETW